MCTIFVMLIKKDITRNKIGRTTKIIYLNFGYDESVLL